MTSHRTVLRRGAAATTLLLVLPGTVFAVEVGAARTHQATVVDNSFDTAGYAHDEVGLHDPVVRPVSGGTAFEAGDRGFVAADLLQRRPTEHPLPRVLAGEAIELAVALPADLTLDRGAPPPRAPGRYDRNWCADDVPLPDFVSGIACRADGDVVRVTVTAARALTVADWSRFSVAVGVRGSDVPTTSTASVTVALRLPTDTPGQKRTADVTVDFVVASATLGIHDLSLETDAGDRDGFEHGETGLIRFRLTPAADSPVRIRQGERFAVEVRAPTTASDGGLVLEVGSVSPRNPCRGTWLPGFVVECTTSPSTGTATITFDHEGEEISGPLPGNDVEIPVSSGYTGTRDLTADDALRVTLTLDAHESAAVVETARATLFSRSDLGVYRARTRQVWDGHYLLHPGIMSAVRFSPTPQSSGAPVRLRAGESLTYRVTLPYTVPSVPGEAAGGLYYNTNAYESVCKAGMTGFAVTCEFGGDVPVDDSGGRTAPTQIAVVITASDPEGSTMRAQTLELPILNSWRDTSAVSNQDVIVSLDASTRQPHAGPRAGTAESWLVPKSLTWKTTGFPSGVWTPGERRSITWTTDELRKPGAMHDGDFITWRLRVGGVDGKAALAFDPATADACRPDAAWDGWRAHCVVTVEDDGSTLLEITHTRVGDAPADVALPTRTWSIAATNVVSGAAGTEYAGYSFSSVQEFPNLEASSGGLGGGVLLTG